MGDAKNGGSELGVSRTFRMSIWRGSSKAKNVSAVLVHLTILDRDRHWGLLK
jgi:hypothetical protein